MKKSYFVDLDLLSLGLRLFYNEIKTLSVFYS